MIDTHTHLFSTKFDNDRDEVILRALSNGVSKMYLPNIDVDTVEAMLAVEEKYPGQCFSMLGLHPTSVKTDYKEQLDTLYKRLHDRPWAAIGEIGTDLYWSDEFWKEQQDAFKVQCGWALEVDRPIVVHCRKSIDETLLLVKPFIEKGLRGVFHCFGGTVAQAKEATAMGLYLGIGGVATYKNNGELPEVLKAVDNTKIVLETDSPYLAPTPKRGRRNETGYLPFILEKVAELMEVSVQEAEELTDKNAVALFA
ncbi:MAG: TatD family hydrolase [Saprospiraceae bacterium]